MALQVIPGGSILSARGFRVGSAACGIRTTKGLPDVALIVSDGPAACAGVFTQNRFAAAPVLWDRSILPSDRLRAIVVNSGSANACTGGRGIRDVHRTAALVAELAGCGRQQVAVASTGIIGHPLPMDRLEAGVRAAWAALSTDVEAARSAERAIMTTDTRPKACAVRAEVAGRPFCVAGMAKGSGMIAPNMATMLAFLTTDARVARTTLQRLVRRAAGVTFNRVTVDGDSSTNDSVFVMAGGAAGVSVPSRGAAFEAFQAALTHVMEDLAKQIARDGEGATKLVEVTVTGARTVAQAQKAARTIADSPLVKCAVHGGDPNWGRVVCAAGYSGVELNPDRSTLELGSVRVFQRGVPTRANAVAEMAGPEVRIVMHLGVGRARATVWTCDLSARYVEINALYHT
jgi:glutamate N-acetyltransferase/amino-acid N-acetyltransferase